MSESSWVLKGVDPETRQRAVDEAARLGVSLADYLTDTVLRAALTDQVSALAEDSAPLPEMSDGPFAPPPGSEGFAVRHRLKSLERRLSGAVGSLDGGMQALDGAMLEMSSRVGDVEAVASDTANALAHVMQDVGGHLAAIRLHISDVEVNTGALAEANDAAHAALADRCANTDQRLDRVEATAWNADRATAILADAQEALKHAVAQDFSDFARENSARLGAGLEEVRLAADIAAQEAEAAATHLVVELRALRDSIEQRLADSAAETRGRMHAAFADAAERMATLTERVIENERFSSRMGESLRAQMADIEDGAQTALEETAESLRQAGAALASEVQRNAREAHVAIESVHADLARDITEVRERQANGFARVKQMDSELGALRTQAQHTHSAWDQRFDGLGARIAATDGAMQTMRTELSAESHRIEECTLAALENLAERMTAADTRAAEAHETLQAEVRRAEEAALQAAQQLAHNIQAGDAALNARMAQTATGAEAAAAHMRAMLSQEMASVNERQDGMLARLQLMDQQLMRAADGAELTTLQQQIGALTAQIEAPRVDEDARARLDDVFARLTAMEAQGAETSEHVHGVARMMSRVSAAAADSASQADDRMHKLEMGLADVSLAQRLPGATVDMAEMQERMQAYEAREAQVESLGRRVATCEARQAQATNLEQRLAAQEGQNEQMIALEERLAAYETRQAQSLDALRGDIARFVADNDRRLESLETAPAPAPVVADTSELVAQFNDLRQRIEERILGVEQRSVRTLEQMLDTVQVLEKRFAHPDERAAQSA